MGYTQPKKPANPIPPSKRSPADAFQALRLLGMTSSEFMAALGGVKCDYCGTVVRGERCSTCGAPRKDLS